MQYVFIYVTDPIIIWIIYIVHMYIYIYDPLHKLMQYVSIYVTDAIIIWVIYVTDPINDPSHK